MKTILQYIAHIIGAFMIVTGVTVAPLLILNGSLALTADEPQQLYNTAYWFIALGIIWMIFGTSVGANLMQYSFTDDSVA